MGRTLMSNIGMNFGMVDKPGMRMNLTLVFLVEMKMNSKQLVGMTVTTSMMFIDEYEAMALNCLLDVEDVDEEQAGDAIQLQLAAHAAFGKAKRKGKFGHKGKPGKGKLVRSHLTIEQRRAKLADLKKRSKCMRCGAIGHWAGDPACKFPGSRGPDAQKGSMVKPTANLANISDRSDDDGLHLEASPAGKHVARIAVRRSEPKSSQPRPSAKASASTSSSTDHRPVPTDLRYNEAREEWLCLAVGQFKGLTFWAVLHDQTNFHKWPKKNDPKSPCYWEWIQWVDRYFDVSEVGVFMRT